jgi:hypothetical protein
MDAMLAPPSARFYGTNGPVRAAEFIHRLLARRALDWVGTALAVAGAVLVGWWLVAALADSSRLPEDARLGPVLGLLLIALGAAAALRRRLAARLVGALASLVFAAFLLVVSANPLRGLTPPPGEPAARPEPVSLVAGLAFVAVALALVLGVPRRGQ